MEPSRWISFTHVWGILENGLKTIWLNCWKDDYDNRKIMTFLYFTLHFVDAIDLVVTKQAHWPDRVNNIGVFCYIILLLILMHNELIIDIYTIYINIGDHSLDNIGFNNVKINCK